MIRVLIADADPSFCIEMIGTLQSHGDSVVLAIDSPTAIATFDHHHPDFIVVEDKIAAADDFKLIDRVVASGRNVPIVIVAADPTPDSAVRFLKRGAEDFLVKPCPPSAILEVVRRYTFGVTKSFVTLATDIPRTAIPNYRLMRCIGSGGYGTVYLGNRVSQPDSDPVAIKIINRELLPTMCSENEALSRFQREAEVMKKVNHPNVVRLIDSDVSARRKYPYVVMEYAMGSTLDKWDCKELHLLSTCSVVKQIAAGLQAIHDIDCVHRDLKPSNIIVGPQRLTKIVDFGVVEQPLSELTRSYHTVGTPRYMSPEAWQSSRVDHRADIFALGVILYELSTGRPPFQGRNVMALAKMTCSGKLIPPRVFNPQIPEVLEDLIVRMLARRLEDRVQTAQEVMDVCAAFTAGDVAKTVPVPELLR